MYFCCISAESEFQKTTATVTVSAGLLLTAIDRILGKLLSSHSTLFPCFRDDC